MSNSTVTAVRDRVDVGGITRTFTVVGSADTAASRPPVLVFHGSGQNAAKHRAFTGEMFHGPAIAGAAVVAYLDGYRGNWNDARRDSRSPARRDGIDDFGFTRAVIAKLAADHGADARAGVRRRLLERRVVWKGFVRSGIGGRP